METRPSPDTSHHAVIIIGAGISGIGTAIRMQEAGFNDVIILEKTQDLGGTWRDNTYPGCECDVPSALYSFSFAQKPDWSKTFAGQAEILDYVRDTAERYRVTRLIRFNQNVIHCQWHEQGHYWDIHTQDKRYTADVMITCGGYLHEPIIPAIPGIDTFTGTLFHSSRWDHHHDLSQERVAVIGTGASAIQFVPEIQPHVKQLFLFQRTPQWILPKPDVHTLGIGKKILSIPQALHSWRQTLYGGFELFGVGFRHPALLRRLQKLAEAHIRFTVTSPELRQKLTPDYTLGCKRVLLSNHYYPALNQSNVSLFATGVKKIEGNRIIGMDGSSCDVDTLILGTGFYVTEPPIARIVHDDNGRSLASMWQHGMQAYRGTVIHGLPNAFMVLGPNLGIGHNSAFIVIEAQINYIIDALKKMRDRRLSRIEVKEAIQREYNDQLQHDLQHTVWNTGGCSSYYLDKNGYNSVGFPWSTFKMRRLLKHCDLNHFDVQTTAEQPIPASSFT